MINKKLMKQISCFTIAGVVGITSVFSSPLIANAQTYQTRGGSTTEVTTPDPFPEVGQEKNEYLITSLVDLTDAEKNQTIDAYSGKKPTLPTSIKATVETGDTVDVKVTWKSDKTYTTNKLTTYTFTPTIDSQYTLSEGVSLSSVKVTIVKVKTMIEGINLKIEKTARTTLTDDIKVYNGYGKKLYVQMWQDKKWVTKKTYTLKDTNLQELKIIYPNNWWYSSNTYWRLYVSDGACTIGYKSYDIKIKRIKAESKITDIATERERTSRYSLTDNVKIYNGYGKKLRIQMYENGKWITKKTYTLKNDSYQELKVYYPNNWWTVTSSKWRMCIDSGDSTSSFYSPIINVKTIRYYQNPSKYIQIQDKITIDNSGGYTLKSGYMGLKTRQVNRYFGIGSWYWPRYTSTTKYYVKNFQKKHGLKVTGNVDKKTWLKMGFSESYWNNAGAYVSPIKVNPSSTKSEHIEAMIDRAYDYLGSDYVVGASGTPSQGADCSGLVMQSLYAAGIEMPGINPVTHSWSGHEYESRNIWERGVFKKVSYSDRKRGDLIFYKDSRGIVNHVAIYLGNNRVIEAWPNHIRTAPVNHHAIKGVMRVFH